MSERTVAEHAAVDFVLLTARGSVQRELLSADRKRWHSALRARAREAGRTVECGHHGLTAWAVLSYPLHDRHTVAPRYSEHAERGHRPS